MNNKILQLVSGTYINEDIVISNRLADSYINSDDIGPNIKAFLLILKLKHNISNISYAEIKTYIVKILSLRPQDNSLIKEIISILKKNKHFALAQYFEKNEIPDSFFEGILPKFFLNQLDQKPDYHIEYSFPFETHTFENCSLESEENLHFCIKNFVKKRRKGVSTKFLNITNAHVFYYRGIFVVLDKDLIPIPEVSSPNFKLLFFNDAFLSFISNKTKCLEIKQAVFIQDKIINPNFSHWLLDTIPRFFSIDKLPKNSSSISP